MGKWCRMSGVSRAFAQSKRRVARGSSPAPILRARTHAVQRRRHPMTDNIVTAAGQTQRRSPPPPIETNRHSGGTKNSRPATSLSSTRSSMPMASHSSRNDCRRGRCGTGWKGWGVMAGSCVSPTHACAQSHHADDDGELGRGWHECCVRLSHVWRAARRASAARRKRTSHTRTPTHARHTWNSAVLR